MEIREGLVATPESTAAMWETAGYRRVMVEEATFRSQVGDIEQWIRWACSNGAVPCGNGFRPSGFPPCSPTPAGSWPAPA
ncbi:hypothetical protein B0E53_00048 [Micromonospora sp. MH33]|uniref:hypothetical protein n=1 Tax=Micromonospora sp. MH33 TaxID=1945509 RepID=UPI000D28B82F|nr:hypothetical protein [Micromonospora sp. MH33]PSK67973.1 hypothetical protein B0E53_00048 [Micromonospora sp. MH33]